ncbi:MAG: hypothetical protein AAF700_06800 [Pseudomonadota bacterium]
MSSTSDDMVLEVLKKMQRDISAMRDDIADIKSDVGDVDQKVNGLTVMMAMLAGHVHDIEERVEKLEGSE